MPSHYVEHGVTVGKSIGVLVMLVLGYWAAGRCRGCSSTWPPARADVDPAGARAAALGQLHSVAVVMLLC